MAERLPPGFVVGAVDDERAVEVVELVLHDACGGLLELESNRLARLVEALDRDRRRALDRYEHLAQREAALVVGRQLLRPVGDHGVHEDAVLVVVDEDEEPPEDADLRRRKADTLRLVHEARHALDEAQELVVESLGLPRPHPQDGVAVLANLRERDQPACLALEALLGLGRELTVTRRGRDARARDRGRGRTPRRV